ncbi:hypothetical protein ASPSYDRAFT_1159531 [Aspergillus sydowii CBS 593.65]|uniref:Uncharacterized protein n=1 Tax=Aspergillus sydowii CBS 593.65 TaxID=1036612 RepID=A0A1L9T8F1_9EURO|nr:uncharacterized protein ASPSYDRAFT_1159531 [Aspergillus sydowii CBS 593.65]OJJ55661.1 hypothetical protein ASPSYDRAFT_1159531 [Aspergillus sydowii CBS 593.65]
MKVSPVLWGWVLSSVAQYAAAAAITTSQPGEPSTTASHDNDHDQNVDIFRVVSTSLSTSTLPPGAGTDTETCITYTSVIIHTIIRTRNDTSTTTTTITAQPPGSGAGTTTTNVAGAGTAPSSGSSTSSHSNDDASSNNASDSVTLTTMTTTVDITTAPPGPGGNTQGDPNPATTDEAGNTIVAGAAPFDIVTTSTDKQGNLIPVTFPAGSVPTTTDVQGHVVPDLAAVQTLTTTTDAQGHVIGGIPGSGPDEQGHSTTLGRLSGAGTITDTARIHTTETLPGGGIANPTAVTAQGPQGTLPDGTNPNPTTTFGTLPEGLDPTVTGIAFTMSSLSSEFRDLLPAFTSWELDPQPHRETQIIKGLKKIEGEIEDFAKKFNLKIIPTCPLKMERGLFDGLFNLAANLAGNAIEALIDALSCITDNMKKLEDSVTKRKFKLVKDIIAELIDTDHPTGDPKDDPTTNPESTKTTTSSSSCTSDQTAHHVTFRCEPTSSVVGKSTVTTTTCSPSTTITTTGCTVTDTTTTVTETATPSAIICERGSCPGGGDACDNAANGTPGWLTVESLNCQDIPTQTASPATKRNTLEERDDQTTTTTTTTATTATTSTTRPLPSIPAGDINKYLSFMGGQLNTRRLWLNHPLGHTTGKWYPFEQTRTAAGVKGLWGCTSVVIVSRKGFYLSHMYEGPVFIERDEETKKVVLSPDAFFERWTINALMNGDSESQQIDPLKDLLGTDDRPGPLHYTFSPEIFIMSPYARGTSGPLRYTKRIDWLANQLHSHLYPQPQADAYGQEPVLVGYEVTTVQIAANPHAPLGKVIAEASLLNHWVQEGDKMVASGRWRMWVGGKETGNLEFLVRDPDPDTAMGGVNARVKLRDNDHKALVCPTPTVTSSHSSTTTITTSKTTSKSQTSKSTTQSPTTLTTKTKTSSTTTSTTTKDKDTPTNDPSLIKASGCRDDHIHRPTVTADPEFAKKVAKMCSDEVPADATNADGDYSSAYSWYAGRDDEGLSYIADIWWDPPEQCGMTQNLLKPMDGWDCERIMRENFNRACQKGLQADEIGRGRGGFIKLGCVYYQSYLSKKTGVFRPSWPDGGMSSEAWRIFSS